MKTAIEVGDLALLLHEDNEDRHRDYYILWDRWDDSMENLSHVGMMSPGDLCIVLDLYLRSQPFGAKIVASSGLVGWMNGTLLKKIS